MAAEWSMSRGPKPADVRTVFDIGVNRGTPDLYEAFPDAHYVLVEPIAELRPRVEKILRRLDGEYVQAAASSHVGTATLNVERARFGLSSLEHRPTPPTTDSDIERRVVPVTTVDQIVADRELRGPFGIKIDTEGHEVDVIRGAERTLRRTEWVIAEVSITGRFTDGYRADQMIGEMRDRGFVIADVLKSTRGWADMLFTPHRHRRTLLGRSSRRT